MCRGLIQRLRVNTPEGRTITHLWYLWWDYVNSLSHGRGDVLMIPLSLLNTQESTCNIYWENYVNKNNEHFQTSTDGGSKSWFWYLKIKGNIFFVGLEKWQVWSINSLWTEITDSDKGDKWTICTPTWINWVSTTNYSTMQLLQWSTKIKRISIQTDHLVSAGKNMIFVIVVVKQNGTVKESVGWAEDLDHFIFQTTERC